MLKVWEAGISKCLAFFSENNLKHVFWIIKIAANQLKSPSWLTVAAFEKVVFILFVVVISLPHFVLMKVGHRSCDARFVPLMTNGSNCLSQQASLTVCPSCKHQEVTQTQPVCLIAPYADSLQIKTSGNFSATSLTFFHYGCFCYHLLWPTKSETQLILCYSHSNMTAGMH